MHQKSRNRSLEGIGIGGSKLLAFDTLYIIIVLVSCEILLCWHMSECVRDCCL